MKFCDMNWEMLGDSPVHAEAYDWSPQWAYVHGMSPRMFAKKALNALVSVLGTPLHAELIDTSQYPIID